MAVKIKKPPSEPSYLTRGAEIYFGITMKNIIA